MANLHFMETSKLCLYHITEQLLLKAFCFFVLTVSVYMYICQLVCFALYLM